MPRRPPHRCHRPRRSAARTTSALTPLRAPGPCRRPQAFPACTSAAAYGSRVAGELAGAGDVEPFLPEWVAVKHILLLGVLWVLQILLFAVRFRWAAAIQAAAAAAGAAAARSLACALKARPPVPPDPSRACRAAPVEFLVALVFAFTSLLPVGARAPLQRAAAAGARGTRRGAPRRSALGGRAMASSGRSSASRRSSL